MEEQTEWDRSSKKKNWWAVAKHKSHCSPKDIHRQTHISAKQQKVQKRWWLSSPGSAHVPTHGHGCRPRLFVLVYEKRFFHLFCLILNVPSLVAQFHLPARTQTHTHIFANQATPTARVDQSKISSNCCCQKMSSICQLSLLIMSEFSSGRRESGLLRFSSILGGLCNMYYAHWEYTQWRGLY